MLIDGFRFRRFGVVSRCLTASGILILTFSDVYAYKSSRSSVAVWLVLADNCYAAFDPLTVPCKDLLYR